MKTNKKLQIAIIGSAGKDDYLGNNGGSDSLMEKLAEEIGFLLAQKNIIVITGGKSGIMNFASLGAKKGGGTTVGVIKGKNRFTSNEYTDVEVISGMEADGLDEVLLSFMSDGCIVIGGGAGTLQEVALFYRNNKPIVVLGGSGAWADKLSEIDFLDERKRIKIITALNAEDSVDKIIESINLC